MSLVFKRQLSCGSKLLGFVKPAFKTNNRDFKGEKNLQRNLPARNKLKAWERAGESKDEFFTKRYSFVHSKRKEKDNPKRIEFYEKQRQAKKRREHTNDREDRLQHKRKFETRDIYRKFEPNPFSEFIYGTSPVLAALKSNKRDFFNKLFVYNPESKDKQIIYLARELGIKTVFVDSKNDLNRLTDNGVHNGFVLETKPLTPQPILELGEVIDKDYIIGEDNYGELLAQPYKTKNINPLGIYVDGVTDPHNVGAIIRSAYFLGADFLVMSEKNNAKLSPIVTKTSVGATEFLTIMSTAKPLNFFERSQKNGWCIISAGSIGDHRDARISQTLQSKSIEFDDLHSALEKAPVLLVLGSEGEGIRTTLKLRSDFIVGIKGGANVDSTIDSLNVSVAAALLMQKTLQG